MISRSIGCALVLTLCCSAFAFADPGDLDATFGSGGFVLGPNASQGRALVRQPDGKLVAVGFRIGSPNRFLVARYDDTGALDGGFGTGGIVETVLGTGGASATAVALQPDGKIVVAGSYGNGPSDSQFAVVRYEADGTLDATFGTGGIVTVGGPTDENGRGVAVQSDGKLVVVGTQWTGTAYTFALARFETDGTLDATFGTGGWVTGSGTEAEEVLIQPDGKLVVVGYKINVNRDFAIARYEMDGTLDAGFGTGGMTTTSMSFYHDQASALVRQADGGFVVGGWTYNGANTDRSLVLVRYDSAGTLDAGFGTAGVSTKVSGADFDVSVGLVEQPDGKLIMGGHLFVSGVSNVAVVRWLSDGTLDGTFGDGGVATAHVGVSTGSNTAQAAVIQPDGRVVVAGSAPGTLMLARFETGLCCTGGPCVTCDVCETCGLAGCENAPSGAVCPDDGNVCTSDACDGGGTCLHPEEPALVCDQPAVAGAAQLKIKSSADPGKDRLIFKWSKGTPAYPADVYEPRLCVYDRSGGTPSIAYQGSPGDGTWTFRGSSSYSLKFKSKTGLPEGVTAVNLKFHGTTATKHSAQVKARGDLALAPFPLQHDPSVVAQLRWPSGVCWGASFSTPTKSDGNQFSAKSD